MSRIKKNKSITIARRISQGAGLLAGVLGLIVPAMTHIIYPGLHCYACPLAVTICPIGIMQNLLKTGFPLFPLAFLGLFGILLGRWWCGWICPFGLINDLFILLRTKQKVKQGIMTGTGIILACIILFILLFLKNKWLSLIPGVFVIFILLFLTVPYFSTGLKRNSPKRTGILFFVFACFFTVVLFTGQGPLHIFIMGTGFFILILASGMVFFFKHNKPFILKFIILVLTIGLAVIAADTLFCKLCPSAALSAALPYLLTNPSFVPGPMYWIKLGILIFTALCMILVARFFCRYICPLGALFGITNKISFLKIRRNSACDGEDKKICKYACIKACIMGIKDIHKQTVLTQTDCIKCGKCIEACPHSHLSFCIT